MKDFRVDVYNIGPLLKQYGSFDALAEASGISVSALCDRRRDAAAAGIEEQSKISRRKKSLTDEEFSRLIEDVGSDTKALAVATGLNERTIRRYKAEYIAATEVEEETLLPVMEGQVETTCIPEMERPLLGHVHRYLFTSAQNNTHIHGPFWRNLLVYAQEIDAQIHVARFTYMKRGLGARGDKASATEDTHVKQSDAIWWDEALAPHFSDTDFIPAPGLRWCGSFNIMPTAVTPLTGLQSHNGRDSNIFPHVKIAMESIPSMRDEATKFNYTTGTVTQRNYIQRKMGLRAEDHHCYAALIVEVDDRGNWFCRQIEATDDGSFQDLNALVTDGLIFHGNAEGINWGDIHDDELVNEVRELAWGEGGMLEVLHPPYQITHDVLTFRSRSHHEMKDPHVMYLKHVTGVENVEAEVEHVASFFEDIYRPWCDTIAVHSNHHEHINRWLKEQDGRKDHVNARFWMDMSAAVYKYIDEELKLPDSYLQLALSLVRTAPPSVAFLKKDESFVICGDHDGGIECGIHGHAGPNGSRGSPIGFSRLGRKVNIGHTHQAGIYNGVYVAGTCGHLSPDWTNGPGSWSWSHIVTYPNGKRTIVTMWNGKWRA